LNVRFVIRRILHQLLKKPSFLPSLVGQNFRGA
jgi:hypothetical protein